MQLNIRCDPRWTTSTHSMKIHEIHTIDLRFKDLEERPLQLSTPL